MDNGQKRHPTYSFFVTKEQAEIMRNMIGDTESVAVATKASQSFLSDLADLKRRVVNLLGAIKRKEKQPTKGI